MPTVSYVIKDFGEAPITGAVPRARLIPSGPGLDAGGAYVDRPVDLTLNASGAGSVTVRATEPDEWVSLEVEWETPDGRKIGISRWPQRFRIPPAGGALMMLADAPPGARVFWVGPAIDPSKTDFGVSPNRFSRWLRTDDPNGPAIYRWEN